MKGQRLKMAAALAALILFFSGGLFLLHRWEERTVVPGSEEAAPDEELVYYNNAWYKPRKGLETVLAIGVDQAAADDALRRDREYEQSDFLLLLVIDRRNAACTAIHINRDTMTEIRVLDDNSNQLLGTITGQLSLAHSYGNCPQASCRNTAAAVSSLLYGIAVDHYFSLTMDGVVLLNDRAGGVTVEVLDDLTAADSALAQGERVTLRGRQALTYVRARMGLENPSNLRRMERQRQYLEALQERLSFCMDADPEFVPAMLLELSQYLVSDCSVEKMSDLAETLRSCGGADYRTLDGEAVAGQEYVEYYVDEASARELVMELFYEKAETRD